MALVWANTPWHAAYASLRDLAGPAALHLDRTLGTWEADGLLGLFFLAAGPSAWLSGSPSGSASACSVGTYVFAPFTKASLDDDLAWSDVLGLSLVAGVGFTVSPLVGELAFGVGSARDDHVLLGVLLGSLTFAVLAAIVLLRNRHYKRVEIEETRDDDADGFPTSTPSATRR